VRGNERILSRGVLAWLARFSALGSVMLVVACNLPTQVPSIGLDRARLATPTETATPAPTKFAIAVYSPTPSPSRTPTITPRPTATPTRKYPTLAPASATSRPTAAPTWKPTSTSAPIRTPTTAPSPTATAVSVGETYNALSVYPSPSDHSSAPAELSIAARGFAPANGTLGLVNIEGPADAGAPQLCALFSDERTPTFSGTFQIRNWDWGCNCPGPLLADAEVTLVSLAVTSGEIIRVPRSSYYIGGDYQALVLYADSERITFNYTRTGNPVRGYTIYLEGLAVDSTLHALYQQTDGAGRAELPALQAGQGIGRAKGNELKAAIRDAGAFMDPRSRKDWWHK